jgi:predicted transcriptional regulator
LAEWFKAPVSKTGWGEIPSQVQILYPPPNETSARQEAGLTQVEAGKLLKKPQAYVSKIERGERGVDAVELVEFAKVYKKSMDYFIS